MSGASRRDPPGRERFAWSGSRAPGPSNGFILVFVLLFSSLLLFAGLAIWNANQTDVKQITTNMARVQAQYLAKGALQIALLKARLLPTPLYDATFYSVGKNPYYLHSRGYGHLSETPPPKPVELAMVLPGPAFLTGEVTVAADGTVNRTNVKTIPGAGSSTDPDDLNRLDGLAGLDWKIDRYLNYFSLDLADRTTSSATMTAPPSGVVRGQPAVSVSETDACPVLGKPDPYSGTFHILGMSVQGARDNRQYGEETIRIVAEASVATKISGEMRRWTMRENTIYKVRRRF